MLIHLLQVSKLVGIAACSTHTVCHMVKLLSQMALLDIGAATRSNSTAKAMGPQDGLVVSLRASHQEVYSALRSNPALRTLLGKG